MIRSRDVVWSPETRRLMQYIPEKGIFLTGIEGSDPMVKGVRRNLFKEAGDFYGNYRERLDRVVDLGITWLRVGPPYSQTHLDHDEYELEWFDQVIAYCKKIGLTVVLDLLHFGLPEWQHANNPERKFFQNPEFPLHFARYASVMAKRYPHISWFTPVNEPMVTASFSSRHGMWNEGLSTAEGYLQASANLAEAAIRARQEIEKVWEAEKRPGEPIFVQNESFEWAIAGSKKLEDEAELFNQAYRFIALDLILGKRDQVVHDYAISRGMSEERYEWFMQNGSASRTLLGIDFYPTCVHVFYSNRVKHYDPTMSYELYRLVVDYWDRYPLPLLHTEVNAWPDHAISICQQTYDQLALLRKEGYPVAGMGWYGDESQVDWHNGLLSFNEESPSGLFRNGQAQEVAALYSSMANQGFEPFV